MNTFIKYTVIFTIAFLALDWAADNPAKVKQARSETKKMLETSARVIMSQYEAAMKELEKQ